MADHEGSSSSGQVALALKPDLLAILNIHDPVMMRHCVKVSTQARGAAHHDTMLYNTALVGCLAKANEFAEALPLARRCLKYWQRMYGVDPETWSAADEEKPYQMLWLSMVSLTDILQGLDEFEEAEPLLIQLLDITQRLRGPEHLDTINCCRSLGVCWLNMRKYDKAEGMLRRVLDFNTRLLGPEHEQLVMTLTYLGRCLTHMGKLEEGEQECRKALALSIRLHGLRHAETTLCMYMLGRALALLQRCDEAEPLARKALEGATRDYGPDHPETWGAASLVQALAKAKIEQQLLRGRQRKQQQQGGAGR